MAGCGSAVPPFRLFSFFHHNQLRILYTHHKTLVLLFGWESGGCTCSDIHRQALDCKTIKCSKEFFTLYCLFKTTYIYVSTTGAVSSLKTARLGMSRGGKKELSINIPCFFSARLLARQHAVFVLPCNRCFVSQFHCTLVLLCCMQVLLCTEGPFSAVPGIPFMMCRLMHPAEVWRLHGNLVCIWAV